MATVLYGPPNEGKIYGTLDVDVTTAWEFITRERAKGNRVTMTHLVTAALGRAIGIHVPEINVWVRRGRLIARDDTIITVAVIMNDMYLSYDFVYFLLNRYDERTGTDFKSAYLSKLHATPGLPLLYLNKKERP